MPTPVPAFSMNAASAFSADSRSVLSNMSGQCARSVAKQRTPSSPVRETPFDGGLVMTLGPPSRKVGADNWRGRRPSSRDPGAQYGQSTT